jgi:formylglycine-generating enzyme required for sulfatase activity
MLMRRMLAGLAVACSMALVPGVQAQCSGDVNGDGKVDSVDLAIVLGQWGTCPATINSVSPGHGSVLGGTVITITGTGLAGTSSVKVGGSLCTGVTVLSPTEVRATTPAGTAGPAAVIVTTPGGTSFAPEPFQYVVQTVNAITPWYGPHAGGTAITITGQYLGTTTLVTVGGVPATNLVVVNSNTVTAVTPPGSIGAAEVMVIGSKGTVVVPGGFTYSNIVPSWATLIEPLPDPAVVTNQSLRNAIIATGYAWRVRDNASQIEMLLVPSGTFNMGCSSSQQHGCEGHELPVHAVTLTNAFYLGRYEVTQAQWTAVMGSNPSYFSVGSAQVPTVQVPLRPVEQVSWNMIQNFNTVTGLRLPTEAEWEYAYRAGTATAFHSFTGYPNGTNDDTLLGNIAWFGSNSNSQTRPVGGKQANALGLHDMSGNVWEWVNDWYSGNYYSVSPSTNPQGPSSGSLRPVRGGSWELNTSPSRASYRGVSVPSNVYLGFGFRVARNP